MDEKKCPHCGHPMMKGPLTVQKREAAWWCADCHFTIWAIDTR